MIEQRDAAARKVSSGFGSCTGSDRPGTLMRGMAHARPVRRFVRALARIDPPEGGWYVPAGKAREIRQRLCGGPSPAVPRLAAKHRRDNDDRPPER